jgi:hypothetical protein
MTEFRQKTHPGKPRETHGNSVSVIGKAEVVSSILTGSTTQSPATGRQRPERGGARETPQFRGLWGLEFECQDRGASTRCRFWREMGDRLCGQIKCPEAVFEQY